MGIFLFVIRTHSEHDSNLKYYDRKHCYESSIKTLPMTKRMENEILSKFSYMIKILGYKYFVMIIPNAMKHAHMEKSYNWLERVSVSWCNISYKVKA